MTIHLLAELPHRLHDHPTLAWFTVTGTALVGISLVTRLAEGILSLTGPSPESADHRDASDGTLREHASHLAERLSHLVLEAGRRAAGEPREHPATTAERREEAEAWLLSRYAATHVAEVARLRREFLRRGLDDPGLEAYWRAPATGEEVARVAMALERLGWALRAIS
jgi:hypothetical protein